LGEPGTTTALQARSITAKTHWKREEAIKGNIEAKVKEGKAKDTHATKMQGGQK
jgi:hypothetical protein